MPARCLYERCLGISRSPKKKLTSYPAQGTGSLLLRRIAAASLAACCRRKPAATSVNPFPLRLANLSSSRGGTPLRWHRIWILPSKACQHIGRVGFAGQYLKAPHGCLVALIFPSRICFPLVTTLVTRDRPPAELGNPRPRRQLSVPRYCAGRRIIVCVSRKPMMLCHQQRRQQISGIGAWGRHCPLLIISPSTLVCLRVTGPLEAFGATNLIITIGTCVHSTPILGIY